jgi:hypothetical protein
MGSISMTDTSITALLAMGADAPGATVGEDELRGVPSIAAFLGESERLTYYLLERHLIPAGKESASWIASRRALRSHYARLTAEAAA